MSCCSDNGAVNREGIFFFTFYTFQYQSYVLIIEVYCAHGTSFLYVNLSFYSILFLTFLLALTRYGPAQLREGMYKATHFLGDKIKGGAAAMVERKMMDHMKEAVHNTITWVKESPFASRQLGFVTGCMLAFGGFVMGVIHFFSMDFIKAALDLAIFFTGCCACAIEYKGMLYIHIVCQTHTWKYCDFRTFEIVLMNHLSILYLTRITFS